MPKRSLKLLVLGGLCALVPLWAVQSPATAEPTQPHSECPYSHAAAQGQAGRGDDAPAGVLSLDLRGMSALAP